MILLLFFLSFFFCFLSYMSMDPMKSCFFLIFCMFFSIIYFSVFNYIWFSYFVSLLFLSGVFVVLVYLSSLSNLDYIVFKMGYLIFTVSFIFLSFMTFYFFSFGVNKFFNFSFLFYFMWIFFIIYFFLFFMSFYMNISGSLRKFFYFFII